MLSLPFSPKPYTSLNDVAPVAQHAKQEISIYGFVQ
jgi:hypothetical protein